MRKSDTIIQIPTALITGAGQGIGRGIAVQLAEAGYDIIANDIIADPGNTRTGLYEVKAQVEACGRRCLPVQADIANRSDHERLVAAAVDEFGAIDLLVNNAGVAPKVRLDILETTEESYDRLMSINARGPFFLTQRVARQMIAQVTAGRAQLPMIIFSTSVSAEVSSPSRPEYCLSKSALSMTARLYAHRLAEYGICVYELRPGIIATEMTSVVKEKYDQLHRRWPGPARPLGPTGRCRPCGGRPGKRLFRLLDRRDSGDRGGDGDSAAVGDCLRRQSSCKLINTGKRFGYPAFDIVPG